MCVIVGGNQGRYWHFQGFMKSSLVPVLLMERASLSFPPPSLLSPSDSLTHSTVFLSARSTPPYPLLSLTLLITKHRGSDEQVALRAAVYKTRCTSVCMCVNTCASACVCFDECILSHQRYAFCYDICHMCVCLSCVKKKELVLLFLQFKELFMTSISN